MRIDEITSRAKRDKKRQKQHAIEGELKVYHAYWEKLRELLEH